MYSQRFQIMKKYHFVAHIPILTTIHDGDELPLVAKVDNFINWDDQFIIFFKHDYFE